MGVRFRFRVLSILGLVTGAATVLAVACGGDDGGGPAACERASCDGGALSETSTTDGPSEIDGSKPPSDGGSDADADSAVVMNCGEGGAPGTLDTTFGDGGIVVLPFAGGDGRTVAIQPDGKIVVAGKTQTAGGAALTVIRLLPDGSLDATFGSGGAVERVLGGPSLLNAVVIQADGKIVAAGSARPVVGDDFIVLRYLANGTADNAFGDAGASVTDFGSLDTPNGVLLLADGRIVVAGVTAAATGDMAVVRLNADGTPDTTFGGTGRVTIDVRGTADQARGVALLAGGKIVLAGTSRDPSVSRTDVAVASLSATGSPESAFADGGSLVTSFGELGADTAQSVAVDSAGRIITAGLRGGNDFGLLRLTAAGLPDPTFGTGGAVRTDFAGRNESVGDLLIDEGGRTLVVGSSLTGAPTDGRVAIARYLPNGGLDSTFGGTGQVLLPLPAGYSGVGLGHGAALSTCGLIVVGSWTDPSTSNRISLMKVRR